jgi:V8-like Glu-specific endopeptidase
MRKLPHSLIGVITMDIEGFSYPGVGTGILISPDLVLTAAHNLWYNGKGNDNFRFYIAHNGLLGQTYCKVKDKYFPKEFTKKRNNLTHDYAILRLTEKTDVKEFIDLKGDLSDVNQVHEIAIYGYPAEERKYKDLRDRYGFELQQCGLIREKDIIENIDREQGHIYHKISTVKGQSGAPILLTDKTGKMTIIGIHKGGYKGGYKGGLK